MPDVGHAVSLVCGPKGMIEAMTGSSRRWVVALHVAVTMYPGYVPFVS